MKASDFFARAVELITGKGAPPTRADVEQAIADCEISVGRGKRELDLLAQNRRALLLGGSDADLAANADEIERIGLERERAEAMAAELRARLAAIVAAEAAAELARRRNEAELQCELAIEALRTRYPKVVAEVHALLRTIATAQKGVDAFHRDFPAEPRIANPEHVARTVVPGPDKVVSEREVWRWEYINGVPVEDCYHAGVVPTYMRGVGANLEDPIIDHIETGRMSPHGEFETPRGLKVRPVRKLRREVVRHDRLLTPFPLANTLTVPGLLADDAGWSPAVNGSDHVQVLAALDRLGVKIERKPRTVVEYLPVAGNAAA